MRRNVRHMRRGHLGDGDIESVDVTASPVADFLLSANPNNFNNDFVGSLSGPSPSFFQSLPATAPSSTIYNPATRSSDTGMSVSDWTKTLANLAVLGVRTYATVDQINQGNSLPYAIPTQAQVPAVVPAAATAPGILDELTDFSTPMPYIAIGGVLLLLVATGSKKSR